MGAVRGFTKRAPRIDVRRPAVMIDSDGRISNVTILDISSGGFRIEVFEAPSIDEIVTLRVEHGDEFPAQIRWALGDEVGGIFLTCADRDEGETGGSSMADGENGADDRRTGEERRKDDRRQGEKRRKGPREGDRRQGDRRQGDRRA